MQPMKTNRSLLVFILLTIVTFGIYELYFLWKMAQDTNILCADDGKKTPGLLAFILLSAITCGIYAIIWWYNLAERLHDTGVRRNVDAGVTGGSFLLWMLLGSFLCGIGSFYALYMIFRALNRLSIEYNARVFGASGAAF